MRISALVPAAWISAAYCMLERPPYGTGKKHAYACQASFAVVNSNYFKRRAEQCGYPTEPLLGEPHRSDAYKIARLIMANRSGEIGGLLLHSRTDTVGL